MSATITAASTATKIKPELHVHFDCLVLSYRKLYANLTAKSNLFIGMKNNKKKSPTDAFKAILKRKQGERERKSDRAHKLRNKMARVSGE